MRVALLALLALLTVVAAAAPVQAGPADKVEAVRDASDEAAGAAMAVAYKAFRVKAWVVFDGALPTGAYVYDDRDLDGAKDPAEPYLVGPVGIPPA